MTLVGCFVTPHPPIILPEVGGPEVARAQPTVLAMSAVRERAAVLAARHDRAPVAARADRLAAHDRLARLVVPRHVRLLQGARTCGSTPRATRTRPAPSWRLQLRPASPPRPLDAGVAVDDLDWGAMVPLRFLWVGLTKPCRLVLLSFSNLTHRGARHVRRGDRRRAAARSRRGSSTWRVAT